MPTRREFLELIAALPAAQLTFRTGSTRAHTSAIVCLAFSERSKLLASGGLDRKIVLWDPDSLEPVGSLLGHEGAVHSLAFSADGQHLFSGSRDKTIRMWHVASRREAASMRGHRGAVTFLRASATHLLSASFDGLLVWRLGESAPTDVRLPSYPSLLASAAASPQLDVAVVSYEDGAARRWEVGKKTTVGLVADGVTRISTVAINDGASVIAAGTHDGTILVWKSPDWSPVFVARPWSDAAAVRSIAFSADARQVLVSRGNAGAGWLAALDSMTGAIAWQQRIADDPVLAIAVGARDATWIATGQPDGTLRVWSAA